MISEDGQPVSGHFYWHGTYYGRMQQVNCPTETPTFLGECEDS